MKTLLEFKEELKIFYAKYDIYVIPLVKFGLALLAFFMIGMNIGYMSRLSNPLIYLILALLCSFLPAGMIAVFGGILIMANAYALSLELFAIAAAVILIMLLLYFRIVPKYGVLLAVTPLAFAFKVPYAVPLVMGLTGNPVTAVPVACGTVVYYLIHYMKLNPTILSESAEESGMQQRITYLIENMIFNKEMILIIVAFALTIVLVYVIRRLSVDYAWQIAIIAGGVADLLVILVGSLALDTSTRLLPLFLGSIAALAIAAVLQFFVFSVDYSRTEYVQFEDDEYYYYVKAVPKISIAVPDKKVKKINAQKKPGASRKGSSGHKASPTHRTSAEHRAPAHGRTGASRK